MKWAIKSVSDEKIGLFSPWQMMHLCSKVCMDEGLLHSSSGVCSDLPSFASSVHKCLVELFNSSFVVKHLKHLVHFKLEYVTDVVSYELFECPSLFCCVSSPFIFSFTAFFMESC